MVNWMDYVKNYRKDKAINNNKLLTLEEAKKQAQKPFEKFKIQEKKDKKKADEEKIKETIEKVGKILKKKGKPSKKEQKERKINIKKVATEEQKQQKLLIDNVRRLEKSTSKLKSTNKDTQIQIKKIQEKLLDFYKKTINKSVSKKEMEKNIKIFINQIDNLKKIIDMDKELDKKAKEDSKKFTDMTKKRQEEALKDKNELIEKFKKVRKELNKLKKDKSTEEYRNKYKELETIFNSLENKHKYKNSSFKTYLKKMKPTEPEQNITMNISDMTGGSEDIKQLPKTPIKNKDIIIEKSDYDQIPENEIHYNIEYEGSNNNVGIYGLVRPEDNKPVFNLQNYKNNVDYMKKPAKSGLPLKALCKVLRKLIKEKLNVSKTEQMILTKDNIIELTAGKISSNHNQEKLESYYEGIGFKRTGNSRHFTQKISHFLNMCKLRGGSEDLMGGSELEGGFLSDEELAKREKIKADLMKKKDEEQKELFLKAEKEEEELNKKLKEMKKLKSMSKTERKKYEIKQRKKLREKQKKEKAELLIKNREERKKRIEDNKQKRIETKKQKEIDKKEKKKSQKDDKIRKALEIKDKDDFDEKAFIPQTKKKKPIPLVDIKHAIKQKKDCIKGYKRIKDMNDLKNFVKQTSIYETEFGKKLEKSKNLLQTKKIIEMYNVKYCPPITKMKRQELEQVANKLGIITDEKDPKYINLRGIAPRRSGANVFKPLQNLTGVKKYYNEKEQKEFEDKLEKQPDPFDVDIIKTDKLGNKTNEIDKLSLRDNQKDFIKKMIYSSSRGSIAFWGVGTGKTILGVMTIKLYLNYYPNGRVLFIAPSGLLSNLVEKLYLFGLDIRDRRIEYYSFERYARIKKGCENTLLMIDEAHNLRTEIGVKSIKDKEGNDKQKITGGRAKAVIDYCSNVASKVLLLTATPLINRPYDMENLLAMIDGRPQMVQNNFNEIMCNKDLLIDYFKNRVSWYSRKEDDKDYPRKNQQFLVGYMTDKEANTFTEVQVSADPSVKAYYSGQRVFINKIGEHKKLNMVVDKIKSMKKSQNIIYMNFVEKGIYKLTEFLKKANIKFMIVSGEEGATEKQEAVESYNNGLISTIIISRAGAEGLDLKNTTNLFVMDMTWNEATREQVIGRGIRYKSHISLPEKDRNVNVYNVFLLKPEEKALMKKVENIKNDKEFSLLLNAYRDKMAEAKANEKGSKKSGREKALRWGNTADILEAKKQGIKIQDYLENVVGDKYNKDKKQAEGFNPPLHISIDLYLYIYSKSKQFVINEFIEFMFKKIPRFEKGVSKAEQIILDKIEKENVNTREGRLKIYEEVLSKYVAVGDKILTEQNEKSKDLIKKLAELNNPTPIDQNKYLYKVKQQYIINNTDIENLYKLSNIGNDKKENLLFLDGCAGNGNIVSYFHNKRKDLELRCCDNDEKNVSNLKKFIEGIGLSSEECVSNENNFLRYDTGERFNYICMNPPFKLEKDENDFSKNILDIDFIRKAFTLLKENGVLVCVIYQKHLKKTIANKRNNMLKDWIMSHKDSITNKTIKLQDITPYAKFFTKTEYQKLGISFVKITKKGYNEDNEILQDIKTLLRPLPPKEVPEFNNEPHLISVEQSEKLEGGSLVNHNTINKNTQDDNDFGGNETQDILRKRYRPKAQSTRGFSGGGYGDDDKGDNEVDEDDFDTDFVEVMDDGALKYKDECLLMEMINNGGNNLELDKFYRNDNQDEYCSQFKKYGIRKLLQFLIYIRKEGELGGINKDSIISLNPSGNKDWLVKYYKSMGFSHREGTSGYMDMNVFKLIENLEDKIEEVEGGSELEGGGYGDEYPQVKPPYPESISKLEKKGFLTDRLTLLGKEQLDKVGKEGRGHKFLNWIVFKDKCLKIELAVEEFKDKKSTKKNKETGEKETTLIKVRPKIYLLEFYTNKPYNNDYAECWKSDSYGIKTLKEFIKYLLENKDNIGLDKKKGSFAIDIDEDTLIHLRTEIRPSPKIICYYMSLGFKINKVDNTGGLGGKSNIKKTMTCEEIMKETNRATQYFMEGSVRDIIKNIDIVVKNKKHIYFDRELGDKQSYNKDLVKQVNHYDKNVKKHGHNNISYFIHGDNEDKKEYGEDYGRGTLPQDPENPQFRESYEFFNKFKDKLKEKMGDKPYILREIKNDDEEGKKEAENHIETARMKKINFNKYKPLDDELKKKLEIHGKETDENHKNSMMKHLINQKAEGIEPQNWEEAHNFAIKENKPYEEDEEGGSFSNILTQNHLQNWTLEGGGYEDSTYYQAIGGKVSGLKNYQELKKKIQPDIEQRKLEYNRDYCIYEKDGVDGNNQLIYMDKCVKVGLLINDPDYKDDNDFTLKERNEPNFSTIVLAEFYKNPKKSLNCKEQKNYGVKILYKLLNDIVNNKSQFASKFNDNVFNDITDHTYILLNTEFEPSKAIVNYYKNLGFEIKSGDYENQFRMGTQLYLLFDRIKEFVEDIPVNNEDFEGGSLPNLTNETKKSTQVDNYSQFKQNENKSQPKFNGLLNLNHDYPKTCIDNVVLNEIIGLCDNVLISGTNIDHLVNAFIRRHNDLNDGDVDITISDKGKGKLYPRIIKHSENKTFLIHNETTKFNKLTKKYIKFNNYDTIIADCENKSDVLNYLRILNQSRAKGIKYLYLINGTFNFQDRFNLKDIMEQIENQDKILKELDVPNIDMDKRQLLGFEEGVMVATCGERNVYRISLETPNYPDDDMENIIADYHKINTKQFNHNDLHGRGFYGNINKAFLNRWKRIKNSASGLKQRLLNGKQFLTDKGNKFLIKSPRTIQDTFGSNFATEIKQQDDIYYYITQESYKTNRLSNVNGYVLDTQFSNENICCYVNNNEVIISYRGSAVIKDFLTDINLARGKLLEDEDFKNRLSITKEIMNKYGNTHKYSVCGHSLGGTIAVNIGDIYKNMYVCVFDMGQGIDITPAKNINGVSYTYYGDIVSCLSVIKYNNSIIIKQPNKENLSTLEAHKLNNFEPPRNIEDINGGEFKKLLPNNNIEDTKLLKKQKIKHPLFD